MYVCICAAVTDKQIRAQVTQGAGSLPELRAELGVCKGCGKCARAVWEMLKDRDQGGRCDTPVACAA